MLESISKTLLNLEHLFLRLVHCGLRLGLPDLPDSSPFLFDLFDNCFCQIYDHFVLQQISRLRCLHDELREDALALNHGAFDLIEVNQFADFLLKIVNRVLD